MSELRLNSFNKGLNNFQDPANLGTELARDLVDVSLSSGILFATKSSKLTGFVDELELNHYGKANRSVAKQFGRYYWSINDAENAPFYGGNDMQLGIKPPSSLLNFSIIEAPNNASEDELSEYNVEGLVKYCYTYVVNGYESAPAEFNKDYYVTANVKRGKVSFYFSSIPEYVQQIKIYRTIDNGAEFYHLNTIDKNTLIGGSYVDNLADIDLLFGEPMESLYYLPPPDNGKYLIEHQGTFFLAVDDKLYFSEVFNCHAWNPSNWISFEDKITGIINEFQGLLVFTANRVYKVVGNDATTIEKVEIPTHQGCINYRTCATLSNAPIWLSNDGICMWDGQSVRLISYGVCKIDNSPIFALSANDCYYLFGIKNVIVYDTRLGGIFYHLSVHADYGWYDPDLDKVFYREKDSILVLFGSVVDNYAVYRTGLLGSNLVKNEFKKLRVNSSHGYTVYINDRRGLLYFKKTVIDSGVSEIYLPTSIWLNGYSLTFQFQGCIREILLKSNDY